MRRVRDERGAVAVIVALLMVPLLGVAAIALDVAGLWWEKQQLQTGADAAALAIAQDCGLGDCSKASDTAATLAGANHAGAGVPATVLSVRSGRVAVSTEATRRHLFAPILGIPSSPVRAASSAAYGAPSAATALLPLAFSWCEWRQQTGGGMPSGTTERVIEMSKSSDTDCTGPSNNVVPGGFGWLTVDGGACQTRSEVNGLVSSDPGKSVPSSCDPADFAAFQNKVVLLPLFDASGGNGANAWYRIYGYAAFTVTGYGFSQKYAWNGGSSCPSNGGCIKGYFTRFVSLDDDITYSDTAPNLGASVVKLTS
jgi:Flp pilus assembly protein TadG